MKASKYIDQAVPLGALVVHIHTRKEADLHA